jgi:hypothetical protein
MSKIDELKKQNKFLNLSVYDVFTFILPNEKSKYIELLTNILKYQNNDTERYSDYYYDDIRTGLTNYGLDTKTVYSLTKIELTLVSSFIDRLLSTSDIQTLKTFIDYNERNLINNKDVTTYKSFSQLMREVSISEFKIIDKNLEKQTKVVYNNDENGWFLIRPLTFSSSRKYGAGTKWCTTMIDEPSYFFRYAKNSILIYAINKNTGYKVAIHYNINDKELTFWNEMDTRIDSLLTELSGEILDVIREEIKDTKDNLDYLDPETRKTEENKYNVNKNYDLTAEGAGITIPIYEDGGYVDRRIVDRVSVNMTIDDNPNMTITTTGDFTTNITDEISNWVRSLSEDPRQDGGY